MYKEEMDRLGFASGGWFKKLAALGSFFDTLAAPPKTAYEELQDKANEKYRDKPADKEMFDVATNYLMEQEDRNIQDVELLEELNTTAESWTNAEPEKVINDYPAKQVKSQWHDVQTGYEIWKTSHIKMQDYYKGEAEKQWEKYELTRKEIEDTPYSSSVASPYYNLQRERKYFFDRYIYYINQSQGYSKKIEALKSKPLSERDLNVYVQRLEDTEPEKYAYYQAVIAYNREQVQSRLARKELAVGPPAPYPKDLIYRDPRLGSVASGNTPEEMQPIIVAIDRWNQGTSMPDVETRYRGYLPAYDPNLKTLITEMPDISQARHQENIDLDFYREQIVLNKERLAKAIETGNEKFIEYWGKRVQEDEEYLQETLKKGITYGPLMEDNLYSLLGKQSTIGIFRGTDPQRIEYRDLASKTHELLHRYINLTGFEKKEFKEEGGRVKNADSEMFVRAYTAKIRGKPLDDEFFKDLKQTAEGGSYTNLEWDEQGQQYSRTFTDVDQFRKDLPGMIERFEKHVLETEAIHEIYPTAQKRELLDLEDKFAPPSTQPIPVPSLLSRLATGAEYKISEILTGAGREEIADLDKRVINYIINSVDQIEDPKQKQLVEKDIRRYKRGTKIPSLSSPFFDVLRHGTQSYEFGNKLLARSALQTKEKLQGKGFFVEGEFYKEGVDPATHKKDALNNLAAFNIKDDNPNLTNEEFNQVVMDRFNESVRKVNNKEKLIPGIDFYLTEDDVKDVDKAGIIRYPIGVDTPIFTTQEEADIYMDALPKATRSVVRGIIQGTAKYLGGTSITALMELGAYAQAAQPAYEKGLLSREEATVPGFLETEAKHTRALGETVVPGDVQEESVWLSETATGLGILGVGIKQGVDLIRHYGPKAVAKIKNYFVKNPESTVDEAVKGVLGKAATRRDVMKGVGTGAAVAGTASILGKTGMVLKGAAGAKAVAGVATAKFANQIPVNILKGSTVFKRHWSGSKEQIVGNKMFNADWTINEKVFPTQGLSTKYPKDPITARGTWGEIDHIAIRDMPKLKPHFEKYGLKPNEITKLDRHVQDEYQMLPENFVRGKATSQHSVTKFDIKGKLLDIDKAFYPKSTGNPAIDRAVEIADTLKPRKTRLAQKTPDSKRLMELGYSWHDRLDAIKHMHKNPKDFNKQLNQVAEDLADNILSSGRTTDEYLNPALVNKKNLITKKEALKFFEDSKYMGTKDGMEFFEIDGIPVIRKVQEQRGDFAPWDYDDALRMAEEPQAPGYWNYEGEAVSTSDIYMPNIRGLERLRGKKFTDKELQELDDLTLSMYTSKFLPE